MPQFSLRPAKRAIYRCLALGLRAAGTFAGRFSQRARGSSDYVAGLIDQGRYTEVDALLGHVAKKIFRPARLNAFSPRNALARIAIDAATERFDSTGVIIDKQEWRYPSEDAPLLVSVVIPCFNYGRYLEEAIASARSQTISSCEIIVVDDGSTEAATRALLDRLADDPGLHVIRQDNQGLPTARNNGIAVAKGEYVCCLDADDLIEPTYLECAIAVLMADRAAGFAYSYVRMFGDVSEIWETREFDIQQALIANFTSVAAVFRRDDWREVGGYSPVMRGGFEDWEFWIRLGSLGRRGRVIAQPLFLHRRHGRTMTHDAKDRQEELQARMRSLNPEVFENASLRRRIRRVTAKPPRDPAAFAKLSSAIASRNKPGLLVVVPWLRRGGAEVLLHSILQGCLSDWQVTLVTTEDDPHLMRTEFAALDSEIFHLHGTIDPKDRIAFLSHIATSRRVTHVLSSGSAWFLSNLPELKRGALASARVANILHNEVPDSTFRAAVAAGAALDQHIAVSRRAATALAAAGVSPARTSEISNGIDAGPWRAAASHRAASRSGLGLLEADKLLLWVGRFAPEKRPEAFVHLVAALGDKTDYRAIMVGEGPLEPAVDAAIARAGLGARVSRLGHRDASELGLLLAAADMLVLTSAIEGLPLVVLEALAVGCPVAATNVGDISRVLQQSADGVLVDTGQPLALSEAIPGFLATFAGEDQRSRIRERFHAGPHTLPSMQASYLATLRAL